MAICLFNYEDSIPDLKNRTKWLEMETGTDPQADILINKYKLTNSISFPSSGAAVFYS